MFRKIMIANRGEIALRVIRACREMGNATVIAHSEADRDSLPVRMADEAACIGPAPPAESYLEIDAIIAACRVGGADPCIPAMVFCRKTRNSPSGCALPASPSSVPIPPISDSSD